MASDFQNPSFAVTLSKFFEDNNSIGLPRPNLFLEHLFTQLIKNFNSRNIKETSKYAKFLKIYTWEKIYAKNYSEVRTEWFQIYSLVLFVEGFVLFDQEKDWKTSLNILDKALLVGAPIYDKLVHRFVAHVKSCYSNEIRSLFTRFSDIQIKSTPISLPVSTKYGIKIPKMRISLFTFMNDFYKKSPVVLLDGMNTWPAMTHRRWSLSYLSRIAAGRTVPIEIGSKYTDNNWHQKLMGIEEFVDNIAKNTGDLVYLAQHNLFTQIPELKEDIMFRNIQL
uniref:Lysine-specific demethylase 8 (Trinotate prediction) n=1 Tax=Myxobolus squamalis TaxID=59785 RepID=A0A6B2GAZ7_MYXSQ